MLRVVVDGVRGFDQITGGAGVLTSVEVPVEARKVAARHFHAQFVAGEKNIGATILIN